MDIYDALITEVIEQISSMSQPVAKCLEVTGRVYGYSGQSADADQESKSLPKVAEVMT